MSIFNSIDVQTADRWVGEWSAAVDEQVARASDLAEKISNLTVDAYTADGAVEVTVDSRGAVAGIRLDGRVLRWTPEAIAEEIMQAIRHGNELMTGRVTEIVRDAVGLGFASERAAAPSFEPPPAPEPAPPAWQWFEAGH